MYKNLILITLLIFYSQIIFSQTDNAFVTKYNTKYTVSENNIITKEVGVSIQINNKTGENLSKISIPFTKESPILELQAQISNIFGKKIRKLKNKDIEVKRHISDISLYEDNFIKTFTLK